MQARCKPDDIVFLSPVGVKIGRNYFGKRFRKYADEAGFIGVNFHDFRHFYTVRKRREGYDKSVIMAQTGHHTDHMFSWYDKVDQSEIQDMAGFTQVNCKELKVGIEKLISTAREKNITLGVAQSLLTRARKAPV